MKQILDMDATELSTRIKNGEITSLQATLTYIEHLKAANERINCVTVDRYEAARQEAIRADLQLQNGEPTGRLHGVPISMKDCFNVAGMATTSGLIHRAQMIETEDAAVVKRLKQEGAIILAKTNTPALCFCEETDNKLHGRTNNPWDLNRSAGGSSGGEGALMAVGGAAVGLGADIGGSIRFPSHYNGIVGFKSANSQVDDTGNFPPVTIPEQRRMLGIGAMGKSVRDAQFIHEILTDGKRKFVDLDRYEIVIPGKQPDIPLGPDTEELLEQIRGKIGEDYRVVDELPPHFHESALYWQELMSINGAKHVQQLMSEGGTKSPLTEYVKEKLTGRSDCHSYLSWALLGAGLFKPSEERLQQIRVALQQGDQELEQYFEGKILILPIYHEAAQKHGKQYSEIFSIRKTYKKYMPYIAYANVWGLPALTLPIGTDKQGMPIGVQLISAAGHEDALFQFGEWVEEAIYSYKRCTSYDL
ncbi:amidase [Paenibacillus sp. FSL W7-1287]|uniref:amidase n=1 Tax=Paenibacillus sp. FSL W7-1287 TaxID=2954538 RepID=UPI0030FA191D